MQSTLFGFRPLPRQTHSLSIVCFILQHLQWIQAEVGRPRQESDPDEARAGGGGQSSSKIWTIPPEVRQVHSSLGWSSGWEHTRSDAATSVLPRRAVASPHWVCLEVAVAKAVQC